MLGFNDMSILVDHFVLSAREREKRVRRDSRGDDERDREERGTGMKVKKLKVKVSTEGYVFPNFTGPMAPMLHTKP